MTRRGALGYYTRLLFDLLSLGPAIEHESSHYTEDIYYKIDLDAISIKIYWGDDEDSLDKVIIEIISYANDVSALGNRIASSIEREVYDVEINYYG